MKFSKAAMFGLDARIALAIFGALSVISGAALYSAIKQARTISYVTELQELAKAAEAYILDTGQDLPIAITRFADSKELVESTVSGWAGPYLSGRTTTHFIYHDDFYLKFFVVGPDDNTLGGVGDSKFTGCVSGKVCWYWAAFNGVPLELANDIDEYIDGAVDHDAGNVRIITDVTGVIEREYVFVKMFPRLDQSH